MWPLPSDILHTMLFAHVPALKVTTPAEDEHLDYLKIPIQILSLSTDSRSLQPGSQTLFVAIKGESFDGHAYVHECLSQNKAALALVDAHNPHIQNLPNSLKKHCILTTDVLGVLRAFAKEMRQQLPCPVLAVAGSNGKTTTKELLAAFLTGFQGPVTKTEKSENGFLGLALTLTQAAHTRLDPPKACVVEIGIDETDAMKEHVQMALPNLALITALGPEHLQGLGNWDNAVKEELVLFEKVSPRVWQLYDGKLWSALASGRYNLTYDAVVIWANQKEQAIELFKSINQRPALVVMWSDSPEICRESLKTRLDIVYKHEQYTFTLPLLGRHNAANAALAWASAVHVGVDPVAATKGVAKFRLPAARSNLVALPNGSLLYNDCYNASPASVQVALQTVSQLIENGVYKKLVLVLGDMLDLGEESFYWHIQLMQELTVIMASVPTCLCLYGTAVKDCFDALAEKIWPHKNTVLWLNSETHPGDFIPQLSQNWLSESVVLVKGSRGMKLERFIEAFMPNKKGTL